MITMSTTTSSMFLFIFLLSFTTTTLIYAYPSNLVHTTMGCMVELLDPTEVIMNQNIIPYKDSTQKQITIGVVGNEGKGVVEYYTSNNKEEISKENPLSFQIKLENTIADLQYVMELQVIVGVEDEEESQNYAIFEKGGCQEKQNRISGSARDHLIHTIQIFQPNTTLHIIAGWATGYTAVTLTDVLIIKPKQGKENEDNSTKEEEEVVATKEDDQEDNEKLLMEGEKLAEAIQHQQILEEEEEDEANQDDVETMMNLIKDTLKEEQKDKDDPMKDIKLIQEFMQRKMKNMADNNDDKVAKEKAMLVEKRLHEKRQALLHQYQETNPEKYRQIREEMFQQRQRGERPRRHEHIHHRQDNTNNMDEAEAPYNQGRRHDQAYLKHMKERRERIELAKRRVAEAAAAQGGMDPDELLNVPVPPQAANDTPGDDDDNDADDDTTTEQQEAYPKHRHLYELNHTLDLQQYFMGVVIFLVGMIGTIQLCLWTSRLEKGRRDL